MVENSIHGIVNRRYITMMNTIHVSVIVPIYNAEKYLKTCLDSLVNQSLKNFEIILVDDGSTDNSYHICHEYSKRDKRITLLTQLNRKQGAARNQGIKIAKGQYIGFLDADDFVDQHYYEALSEAVRKHNADVAVASVIKVVNGRKKQKWLYKLEELYRTDFEKFVICKQKENLAVYNKIYKKELINKHELRFPEGVFYEDGPFSVRVLHYANKIVTVPNVSYYYVKNLGSTVNSKQTEKHITDATEAKKDILQFAREKDLAVPSNTFHYTKKRIKRFGITLYSVKENIKSEVVYAFGVIPIYWRETGNKPAK
ncbi:MAG: glycosyltransferase [Holosporales bacterium]|jgi:glycosyltransferase involved in cell wall biosynthesis|nr:glycosyltransferase [Holosporales bacterium]